MRKFLLGLSAAAIVALAGQAFLATPADAAQKTKYCVWHEATSNPNALLVSSVDIAVSTTGWEALEADTGEGANATGSLANHLRHGDTCVIELEEGDLDCDAAATDQNLDPTLDECLTQ